MSIFPKFNEKAVENSLKREEGASGETLPMPLEYAWDFEKNDFIVENGEQKIVKGKDAVKIWIYKALKTERYRYPAYTWNFGQEFEKLMGIGLTKEAMHSEIKRYLNEALKVNPYIKEIRDVHINIIEDKLNVSFTVDTPYSEVKIDV